jgi:hypothetical protein
VELTLTRKKPTETGPFTPGQPRVNLVPPSALDRAADRRARKLAAATWGVCAIAVAGIWGTGLLTQTGLKTDLADALAEGEQLSVELAQYAPVTSIASQTKALNDTVASQTAGEVDHSDVVTRFLAAVGDTMVVDTLQISTDGAGACVSTDPFQQVPLAGCISFSGQAAAGGASASQIIAALGGDTWFSDPFIPSVGAGAGEDGAASFAGTVGLTMEAQAAPPADPAAAPTDAAPPVDPGTEN